MKHNWTTEELNAVTAEIANGADAVRELAAMVLDARAEWALHVEQVQVSPVALDEDDAKVAAYIAEAVKFYNKHKEGACMTPTGNE